MKKIYVLEILFCFLIIEVAAFILNINENISTIIGLFGILGIIILPIITSKNDKLKNINNKTITIIIIILSTFILALLIPLLKPQCDDGWTLIDGECYNCKDGYTLNVNDKTCEKNRNETDINTDTSNKKTNQEIIADYKENCIIYNYEEIYRYAEKYEGKKAKFTGEIIQISSYGYYQILRVNVTKDEYGYYDDTIYVSYYPMENATRLMEDDIVTVYGILDGLETYTSVTGKQVTIPKILSTYIELN